MKIAIISDIHSNLEALKATLEDIKKRKVDKIVCLGDIIGKGVHSGECIKLIRENCEVVIRGNWERQSAKTDFSNLTKQQEERVKWMQSMLTQEEKDYLINLPFCHEFYISGSLVRMFHSTPYADNEDIFSICSIETKAKMFDPTELTNSNQSADIAICAHMHYQYMDKLYNRTLINVGSVGDSLDLIRNDAKDASNKETAKSNYFIIEGEYGQKEYTGEISFQFVRVVYDIEKELNNDIFNIEKDEYEKELKEGRYRDMNKIYENLSEIGIDVDKI